jgi:hypothetical protein
MSGLKISELPSGQPTLSGIIPFTNDAKNTTFHADVQDFLKLASLSGLSDVDLNVVEINDGYLISYSGGTWVPVSGVSIKINNEGDNRLLTSAGDGEIDAESNLTFNGNLLSITGNILANSGTLDRLIFNTSLGDPNLNIAQLAWNPTEGTVDLGISDSYAMHIGEELHYRVRNNTGSTLLKGTPVYASGVTAGGNPRIVVAPFTADGLTREVRFMGLVTEDVNTGINGYTTHFGYIRGIDTRGDAAANGTTNKLWAAGEPSWSEGDILYPHPTVAGKLTKVEPKHSISVAIILNRHQNNGKIFVRPTSYGHLDDNHDVNVSGVTSGQFLQYDAATDYWIPSSSGNFTNLQVNGTTVSVSGHTHVSNNITNFDSAVSGLLPVTNIIGGTNISVTPNGSVFTVNVSGSLGLTTEEVDDRVSNLLVAGTGIVLSYNDEANALTISTSGLQPSGNYSVVGHTHTASNITDFNASVSGLLSPAGLSQGNAALIDGSGNNYNPSVNTDTVRMSGINTPVLTGLSYSNYDNDAGLFINVGANNITLKHLNSSSDANNRFSVPWAGDYVMSPSGGAALLVRDKTDNIWRVV